MSGAVDATELISLARETVLTHLLPGLEGDARYQALMCANALAIALRELAHDDAAEQRRQLQELYGEVMDPELDLEAMNMRLARDIRRGELDGGVDLGLRRLLRAQVRARLEVSNPRRLGGEPASGNAR